MAVEGDLNPHAQRLVERTARRGNHRFARFWKLACSACGAEYGANSCDFHIRRCPNCQHGTDGLPLT